MIEIRKRGKNWEAFIDGCLWEYKEDLGELLERLFRNAEDIEREIEENK